MKKYLLLLLLIVLVVVQKSNAQTLVAYYPLNGNANDASGNMLNGTVSGTVTPVADRFGNANSAMSFPGNTNSFIQIADNPLLRPASITISCWVNVTGGGINTFVQKALSPCVNDGWFSGTESGNFRCYVANSFTCGDHVSISSPQINNVWKFIVFTVDAEGDTRNLYVDGVLVATDTYTSTLQYDNNPVLLGAHIENGVFAFPLLGSLDEVKIYNTALTAAQVQNEYLINNNYSSQFNNSVKMNGANDQIELGSTYTQQIFTVEMWVKPGATQNNFANLIDNNHTGTTNWVCQQNAGNTNLYGFGVNTNGVTAGVEFQLQSNVWQHIALIRDATVVQVYVNGVLIQSNNISGTNTFSGQFLRLGNWGGGGRNWNGTMDEVRYWGTARTQAEIVANMNSQLTGNEADLIGYWDMNRSGQGTGLTVDNKCVATGAALNGTTVGTASTPIFAPGVVQQKPGSGNAISFDGVNNHISIPHSSNIDFALNDNFSIECWLKIPATQNDIAFTDNMLIEKWNFGSPSPFPFTVRYYNQTSADNGKIRFGRYNGATGASAITVTALNDDKFHHLSFVKNGGTLSIYIDGVFSGSAADIATGSTSNTDNLYFGSRGGAANFFKGSMDEIRIWNTALTQSQIRDRVCRKITSSDALYSNLVAYYNFDESAGNTAFDATGNTNDGILTNTPTRVTSGAAIGTASSHDYVNTIKTTLVTHPTGENFSVTSTSGNPDGIHVYRVDEQPNTLNGAVGVGTNNKYFGVFQAGGTAPQYTAVYNYNGNPGVNIGNEFQLRLNKRTDNAATTWSMLTNAPDETANTITVTGESTEYILGKLGTVLPVSILSFTGTLKNQTTELQWKVTDEINIAQFVIERSNGTTAFVTVGTRQPLNLGNTNYTLTDKDPFTNGTQQYYRLKIIDKEGRFKYSNIIRIGIAVNENLSIFPNPVKDVLTISGLQQSGTIKIISADGKKMQQQTVTAQTITVDMGSYAKGVYLLQYTVDGEVVSQKIIKQ